MTFSTLWPFLLAIPALLLGGLAGWLLRAHFARSLSNLKDAASLNAHIVELRTLAEGKRQAIHQAEAVLAQLDLYLATLNRDIASAREQVLEREREHVRLLQILDERTASVEDVQGNLHDVRQRLRSREQETEALLASIEKSIEELDLLRELHENYLVKIGRLTQQVEWQDSELRMLHQMVRAKTTEINQAQALLDQRDAELRRIIRQRQQREVDLAHARRALGASDAELRRLLKEHNPDEFLPVLDTRPDPVGGNRLDVTPKDGSKLLPDLASDALETSPEEPDDDLTELPGLAEPYAEQLRAHGIRTFRQLAQSLPEDIRRLLTIPGHYSPDIAGWIDAARRRTGGNPLHPGH